MLQPSQVIRPYGSYMNVGWELRAGGWVRGTAGGQAAKPTFRKDSTSGPSGSSLIEKPDKIPNAPSAPCPTGEVVPVAWTADRQIQGGLRYFSEVPTEGIASQFHAIIIPPSARPACFF